MGAKINLVGQKFTNLTVLEETNQRSANGGVIWRCQCDCGKETFASSSALRRGEKRSCGCLQKTMAAKVGHNNLKDLIGKRFGNLLVLQRVKNHVTSGGAQKTVWECKCDCGSIIKVQGQSLVSGNTSSCGCIKSKGEEKISRLLSDMNIPFEREKIFSDAVSENDGHFRYDFYVDDKYIIEYDGKQHFENSSWGSETRTKEDAAWTDHLKDQYCFSHNIPIIRIPYTYYDSITIKELIPTTSKFLLSKEE